MQCSFRRYSTFVSFNIILCDLYIGVWMVISWSWTKFFLKIFRKISFLIWWFLFKLSRSWMTKFLRKYLPKVWQKNEENSSSTWLAPIFQLIFHVVTENTYLDKSLDKNCLLYEKHCHFVRRFSLLIYVCTYQWYHTIYLYYLVVLLDDVVDIDFVVVFTKNDTNFFLFFGSLNQFWNWIHRFHRYFFSQRRSATRKSIFDRPSTYCSILQYYTLTYLHNLTVG